MTNDAVNPLTCRLVIVSIMGCICLPIRGNTISLSLQSLIRLCMMHITFKFNAYSVIKVFSLSIAFVERILVLVEDFVLINFPQHHTCLSYHLPPPSFFYECQ